MPTFDKIPEIESKFRSKLRAAGGIYFEEIAPIYPSAVGVRPKRSQTGDIYESYYFTDEYQKRKIVIHSTAGFLNGDMGMIARQDVHMSVAYVIARDGTVYELFNPKYWSYHLGRNSVGGNSAMSKESIAIELSNIGPLTLSGTDLINVYGSKYCSLSDVEQYTKVEGGFRGYDYFASFTNEQYISLNTLLTYLSNTFNIPYEFLSEDKRVNIFSSGTAAKAFRGICTHVNFRPTGKYDLGPDFDWNKIIETSDIIIDPDQEFVYEDDSTEPLNVLDPNYGKAPKTAIEKAEVVNNSNSSSHCSIKLSDKLEVPYIGGKLGSLILNELDDIDWNSMDYSDGSAMRLAGITAIATGIYNFITDTDNFSVLATTTGSYIIPPSTTVYPVELATLETIEIEWPSLLSLIGILNKYYTDIGDLFSTILIDWLGEIVVTPIKESDPATVFLDDGSISGNFSFKWDSTIVAAAGQSCVEETNLIQPGTLIDAWKITEKWLFTALSTGILGEQNGTGIYNIGPSIGSAIGGGASVGYALGVQANTYTPVTSTCTLTFENLPI